MTAVGNGLLDWFSLRVPEAKEGEHIFFRFILSRKFGVTLSINNRLNFVSIENNTVTRMDLNTVQKEGGTLCRVAYGITDSLPRVNGVATYVLHDTPANVTRRLRKALDATNVHTDTSTWAVSICASFVQGAEIYVGHHQHGVVFDIDDEYRVYSVMNGCVRRYPLWEFLANGQVEKLNYADNTPLHHITQDEVIDFCEYAMEKGEKWSVTKYNSRQFCSALRFGSLRRPPPTVDHAPPAPAADIYEEEEWDAEPSVVTSASMRSTSSVIGGGRRSDAQTHKDDAAPTQQHQRVNEDDAAARSSAAVAPDDVKDERDDPQQAAVSVVAVTWEEATTPPPAAAAAAEASKPRNPFAPDDDEDAAFYGIAAGGATQSSAAKVTYAPVAFGAASAIQVYPSGSGAAPAPAEPQRQHDNNALSFQRTLTEIVEDVDRSDAQDQQVWEDQQQQQGQGYGGSFAGNSPFLPRKHNSAVSFGDALSCSPAAATTTTTLEPHDEEDAFANMLMHFVSKAKDGE